MLRILFIGMLSYLLLELLIAGIRYSGVISLAVFPLFPITFRPNSVLLSSSWFV